MVSNRRRLTSIVYFLQHSIRNPMTAQQQTYRCTVLWQRCTTPSLQLCLYLSRVRSLCNADGQQWTNTSCCKGQYPVQYTHPGVEGRPKICFHWNYRVIHKSLRDFRTGLRNNQDRHGRKEHINRQRISPSFFLYQGPWRTSRFHRYGVVVTDEKWRSQ